VRVGLESRADVVDVRRERAATGEVELGCRHHVDLPGAQQLCTPIIQRVQALLGARLVEYRQAGRQQAAGDAVEETIAPDAEPTVQGTQTAEQRRRTIDRQRVGTVHERDRRHPGALGGDSGAGQHPIEYHDIGGPLLHELGALARHIDHEGEEAILKQPYPSAESGVRLPIS
jgi:hypothetical protein